MKFSFEPKNKQKYFSISALAFKMGQIIKLIKPSQNKKGRKNFQLHCFLNTFYSWQLRKCIQKRCSWKIFKPFLFCDGFSTANATITQKHSNSSKVHQSRNSTTSGVWDSYRRKHSILGWANSSKNISVGAKLIFSIFTLCPPSIYAPILICKLDE